MWSDSVVPKVVAKPHSANFSLFMEWIVNLLIRDFFAPSAWDFSQLTSSVLGRIHSAWEGFLLLGWLQLNLLSVKRQGLSGGMAAGTCEKELELAPSPLSKRVSPFQRALKWNAQ